MASAELGVNVGVTAQLGTMEATGNEGNTAAGTTRQSESAEALFGTAGFFAEKELNFLPGPLGRISIGFDNIGHDIALGTATNHVNSHLGSALETRVANPTEANGGAESFTNQASADITGFKTVYATLGITDWLYVKAGNVTVDVTTTEKMESGGSYDNATLDGTVIGAGFHHERDNGLFMRLEVNQYDIDGVTLQNKGDTTGRSVQLTDVDGTTARFSIGKAF